jgi:hypothetical protein
MNALACACRRHRLGLAVLALLSLLDVATTSIGLYWFPSAMHEQNPLGVAAWALAGPLGLTAVKLAWMALWLPILWLAGRDPDDVPLRRLISVSLFGTWLFYTWIVAQNALLLLTPAA